VGFARSRFCAFFLIKVEIANLVFGRFGMGVFFDRIHRIYGMILWGLTFLEN
jgi:hypothetical protein